MRVLIGRESLPKVEADWLRGRDRELYLPLLTILYDSPIYEKLEQFLRQRAEEKRLEKENSLEAVVTRVVARLLEQGEGKEIVFSELWGELLSEINGEEERYPNSLTVRAMVSDMYGRITKKEVASILKDKLGMERLKTKREGLNLIVYIPNMPKLERAYKKYRINSLTPNSPNPLEAYTH